MQSRTDPLETRHSDAMEVVEWLLCRTRFCRSFLHAGKVLDIASGAWKPVGGLSLLRGTGNSALSAALYRYGRKEATQPCSLQVAKTCSPAPRPADDSLSEARSPATPSRVRVSMRLGYAITPRSRCTVIETMPTRRDGENQVHVLAE